MIKPSILIGIPTVTPQSYFLESVRSFIQQATEFCEINEFWVHNKPLVEAQNEIGIEFMDGGYDCLLLLEDDISGHTIEMLDEMLFSNHDVVAVEYLSRHEPFYSTLCRNVSGRWFQNQSTSGIEQFDQVSFGMTLIKRKAFEKLEYPYFRVLSKSKSKATDADFCERLRKSGVKLYGLLDYELSHRGINRSNVHEKRMEIIKSGIGVKSRLSKWRNSI